MSVALIEALVRTNLAASAMIVLVLLLRTPLRKAFGSQLVYGLWAGPLLAAAATFIPMAPPVGARLPLDPLVLESALVSGGVDVQSGGWETWIFGVWIAGAAVSLLMLAMGHRKFLSSEAMGEAGPGVTGVLKPRLIIPDDFASRFGPHEREMILAHERAHLARFDTLAITLAALIRCLCWFNPFVHIATRLIREDQEFACDEIVLAQRKGSARDYAQALVKAQITSHVPPLGCHWPLRSIHSLEKRVVMLERKPNSAKARAVGCALVAAVVLGGGYASWAADLIGPVAVNTTAPASSGLSFRVVDDSARGGVREGAQGPDGATLWLLPAAAVTGDMVESARAVPADGGAQVDFTLTPPGAKALAALTQDNVGRRIAILVDGQVVSAPLLREPISGGKGQITGSFNLAQAQELAARITAAAH